MGITGRIAVIVAVALLALPAGANASFPGQNGKLLLERPGSQCLWTVNPDGTGLAATPVCLSFGYAPKGARFSPDGTHVAYNDDCIVGVFTAKLDGSDTANVESGYPCQDGQAWSPDGTRLAIGSVNGDQDHDYNWIFTIGSSGGSYQFLIDKTCPPDTGCSLVGAPDWSPDKSTILFVLDGIFKINASGGASTRVTAGQAPSWSPDGSRIAFARYEACGIGCTPLSDIYVMNPDGSGQVNITNSPAYESRPIWSPDGRRIAFTSTPDGNAANNAVWTMNLDGSGAVQVTGGSLADWQPIPYTGYARPRGAGPFLTYLVPAYKPCVAANRTHGAPLSFPSCAPPQQASDYLTVGTSDSNGQPNKSIGSVKFAPRVSPADFLIQTSITDVRNKSDLSDYTGRLQEVTSLRITDRYNGPSLTDPATVQDIPLPIDVPCAGTDDTTVGSTCAVSTSANAIIPGMVRAQKRMIIELGQVRVDDGGADGDPSTGPQGTLFMDQGVFIP